MKIPRPTIADAKQMLDEIAKFSTASALRRSKSTPQRLNPIDQYITDILQVLITFSSSEFFDVLNTMDNLFKAMDDRFEKSYSLSKKMYDLYVKLDDGFELTDDILNTMNNLLNTMYDLFKTTDDRFGTMDELLASADELLRTVNEDSRTKEDVLRRIFDAQRTLDSFTVLHVEPSLRSRLQEECARLEDVSQKALALNPPSILEPIQSEIITISELNLTFIEHLRRGLEYEDSIEFGAEEFRNHMILEDPMRFADHLLDHLQDVQSFVEFSNRLKPDLPEDVASHSVDRFLQSREPFRCSRCRQNDPSIIEAEIEEAEAILATTEAQADYLRRVEREYQVILASAQVVNESKTPQEITEYEASDAQLRSIIKDELDKKEQACKTILRISPPTSLTSAHNQLQAAINLYLDGLALQRSLLANNNEELDEETKSDMIKLAENIGNEFSEHMDRYFEMVGHARDYQGSPASSPSSDAQQTSYRSTAQIDSEQNDSSGCGIIAWSILGLIVFWLLLVLGLGICNQDIYA